MLETVLFFFSSVFSFFFFFLFFWIAFSSFFKIESLILEENPQQIFELPRRDSSPIR